MLCAALHRGPLKLSWFHPELPTWSSSDLFCHPRLYWHLASQICSAWSGIWQIKENVCEFSIKDEGKDSGYFPLFWTTANLEGETWTWCVNSENALPQICGFFAVFFQSLAHNWRLDQILLESFRTPEFPSFQLDFLHYPDINIKSNKNTSVGPTVSQWGWLRRFFSLSIIGMTSQNISSVLPSRCSHDDFYRVFGDGTYTIISSISVNQR